MWWRSCVVERWLLGPRSLLLAVSTSGIRSRVATGCFRAPTPAAMPVASREQCNDTAGVLRRAAAGEVVEVTVNGEPVAELSPIREQRSHWTHRAVFARRVRKAQADPALDRKSVV